MGRGARQGRSARTVVVGLREDAVGSGCLGEEKTFTALAPEEQRELLEGVRELRALRALLTEEAAAPARDEETAREPPAPPARVEETGREPPAPRTPEDGGQAESSDPVEPDEPEPGQGRLPF